MNDIYESIEQWRAEGAQMALATVITVSGSAPRGEGAKMVITRDGKIAGSVSGGCVESDVAQAAQDVFATGHPVIVHYGINRNMMWDVGLSCGGAIDVFIEPLPQLLPPSNPSRPLAICTVVRGPSRIGAKLMLDDAGQTSGGLGDASLEAQARQAAQSLMEAGQSKTVALGAYEVFIDACIPEARLLIVGAVHIAVALCEMAARAGFSVTVIDPRPALCNHDRFPDAANLVVDWPQDALAKLVIDENTYVAVLTHDEKFDDPSLLHVLPLHPRYVGAIGSKKTQALRRQRLLDAGITSEAVSRLHGPIGLDVGAQTPEEIAVAILAEMIAAKYKRSGISLRDRTGEHIHA
jgi:xanthine dehydrogenase accessory factor